MKTNLISALVCAGAVASSDKQLKFNADGKFKIIQFTDLHFGCTDAHDQQNQETMRALLDYEKPDLVVNTGDVFSGFYWDGKTRPWSSLQWDKMASVLTEEGYNWASTAGNHDSQGDLSRSEIHDYDMTYDMSLTKPNAGDLSHSFNYVLPVYDENGESVVHRLWFLDTGDMGCLDQTGYDCVRRD